MRAFPPRERHGLYRAIVSQRETRLFRPNEIPDVVLARLLQAAERAPCIATAPSWKLVIIRDGSRRRELLAKIGSATENLCEAPLHICIICEPSSGAASSHRFSTLRSEEFFNVCCAIQNLWLAARAEGLGIGWIDVADGDVIREVLGIPFSAVPFAYLCLGYAKVNADGTDRANPHTDITELIYEEQWGRRLRAEGLIRHFHSNALLAL